MTKGWGKGKGGGEGVAGRGSHGLDAVMLIMESLTNRLTNLAHAKGEANGRLRRVEFFSWNRPPLPPSDCYTTQNLPFGSLLRA